MIKTSLTSLWISIAMRIQLRAYDMIENRNGRKKLKRLFFLLQIEGLQRHPRYGARVERRAYRNMLDGLRQILMSEGWHGLYKGIVPSTVKAAPAGAVTFVAYEFTSDWLESISW